MATWHPKELVLEMIREHEFTRMAIFDLAGTDAVYRVADKDPEFLCSELERILPTIEDAVRVECGKKGDLTDTGGRPSLARKPMVWRIRPDRPAAAPVAAPVAAPAPVTIEKVPAGYLSPELFQAKLEVEKVRLEMETLRMELDAGRVQDEGDEGEELDVAALVAQLQPLLQLFTGKAPAPASPPAPGIGGVREDAALLDALEKLRAKDPDTFNLYRGKLLEDE